MKWRYKELVGRIPATKMIGSTVQYYIEVKDAAGTVVTSSGKSTSPNLDRAAGRRAARFYPDFTDDEPVKPNDGGGGGDSGRRRRSATAGSDDDDPLNSKKKQTVARLRAATAGADRAAAAGPRPRLRRRRLARSSRT